MGKHYVPRFYLDGFTSNGRLWAHDKVAGRSFSTQPKSVANESDAYPDDLERYFANEIEDRAKDAIVKVRRLQPLSSADRDVLADYIVSLWKRVPAARQRAMESMPTVGSSVRNEIISRLEWIEKENPALAPLVAEKKMQVETIVESHCDGSRHDVWHQTQRLEMTPKIGDALKAMHWRFLFAPDGMLLTSDNPVFFFAHEGIGSPQSELTLPFSSTVAIWANRRPDLPLTTMRFSPYALKELNRRTVFNASRFVFSAENEAWVLPLVLKKSLALNRMR
jgi:hypothetical protein